MNQIAPAITTSDTRRNQIVESLVDKEYRDLFVAEEIVTALAFQVRAMRDDRGWSQAELAERSEMSQEAISRIENPEYGRYTLTTLKRLAAAFDVALTIRLESFSTLVDWVTNLSADQIIVPSFENDYRLHVTHGPDYFYWTPEGTDARGYGTLVQHLFRSETRSLSDGYSIFADTTPGFTAKRRVGSEVTDE